jgi:hypothetical protein
MWGDDPGDGEAGGRLGVGDDGHGAAGNGFWGETGSIDMIAWEGEKKITGPDTTAVVVEPGYSDGMRVETGGRRTGGGAQELVEGEGWGASGQSTP